MKIIIAYIRPERLSHVKKELFAHGLYALSVTNILGSGRQKGYTRRPCRPLPKARAQVRKATGSSIWWKGLKASVSAREKHSDTKTGRMAPLPRGASPGGVVRRRLPP